MRRPLELVVLAALLPAAAPAQEKYREPPAAIRDILRGHTSPSLWVSPDGRHLLAARAKLHPPVSELAAPMLRLAGVRIDPRNNAPHGQRYLSGVFTLQALPGGEPKPVQMPEDLKFGSAVWNQDGSRFAFLAYGEHAIDLWIGETAGAQAQRVAGLAVNPMLGSDLRWLADGATLIVKAVPAQRGAPPAAGPPLGPDVQDSRGVKRASSTYEARDLLRSPHDADLFEHYAASEIARVDAKTLEVTRLGQAAVYGPVQPAPGGAHLLVARVERPYSFVRPWSRFPRTIEVWDRDGRVLETVAKLPLAEQVPIDGEAMGPRNVAFVPTLPATLCWVEALDQGDWAVQAPHRDRVFLKEIGKPAQKWIDVQHRFAGLDWIEGGDLALLTDYQRDRRWIRTFVVDRGKDGDAPRLLRERDVNDAYGDPGRPVHRQLASGAYAVRRDGDAIFMTGDGATPQGDRPFLDRFDLASGKTERLFRAGRDSLERFLAWHDFAQGAFLTRKESPKDPPNLALRTLGAPVADAAAGEAARTSAFRMLTRFPDPAPQIRGVTKQLAVARRADGVEVSFTYYLPPGHAAGTPLPTVFWAYPLEYSDPTTASQVQAAPNAFTSPFGAAVELFTLAGYAVLDVAMPVVGPPETVYDTFIEQIVANARAVIEKAAEMGITDPDRVGVGGHSHGALMTANLLAWSDLFRAGIARSGAYNHTLRPFGFQNEHRTLYQARETYLKLSPLVNADRIDEPLLVIHGAVDANPGTVPLQSEKLFEAVRGVGGTARLIMLPCESHGYLAQESNEHVMAEGIAWFDEHVKNAPPREQAKAKAGRDASAEKGM
jgi:dipeptidyl aminopeptidase/acylaminoacyl peptidase